MRDFRAGNKSVREYVGKEQRNREWNPYVGEEEPVEGGCAGNCGNKRTGRGYVLAEMPKLSEKEQDDVMRWNCRRVDFSEPGLEQKERGLESPGPEVRWNGGGQELPGAEARWNGGDQELPGVEARWNGEGQEFPEAAVRRGGRQPVPPILVPERRKQPPRRPEWGIGPQRPPMQNRPGAKPEPESGKQPPRRPEWGIGPQRPPMQNRPGAKPEPESGKQPPRRPEWGIGLQRPPMQNRPGPKPEPESGKQPPQRPEWGIGSQRPPMQNRPQPRLVSEWESQPQERSVPLPEWRNQGDQSNRPGEFRDEASYIRYDYEDIIEDEKKIEQDLRLLQSMYPEAVKEILPCVVEICDRMEYEGSMMFDEYPDKGTVRRLSDEIYEQTGDVWPREPIQEPDGVMSMQYQGNGRGPLGELIQILLLQEMHHRRCRHHRCRPHMF